MRHLHLRTGIAVVVITLAAAGCRKKVAAAPHHPPAPAAAAASTPPPARQPAPARSAESRPAPQTARSTYPDAATRARIDELLARIEDAYFDYNQANLRPDAQKALTADSTELRNILKDYPAYKLTIEGHCDERGSAEYNIALGDRRAQAAKEYLVAIGIPSDQLNVISYGKDRPVCQDPSESCWQKNRRIHIVAMARAN